MKKTNWIKLLFIIAGIYDGILGILFLIIPLRIYQMAQVTPPNHIGYVQFPALLLIIFAVLFFQIAKDPVINRNLILYGISLKFSYCAVVFPHWWMNDIPFMWVPFAFCDLLFLILFILVYQRLKPIN